MSGPIVVTAGGTGGHMFPALALATELERRGMTVTIACDRRGARFLPETREALLIRAASPSGSSASRLRGLMQLGLGLLQSWWLLRKLKPRAVASFGSYASVPVGLAAGMLGIPLVVHEQNAVLGRANRMVTRRARRLALTFAETRHAELMPEDCRVLTGNPVRPEIRSRCGEAYQPPSATDQIRVLVIGGSQGATSFSHALPAALDRLTARQRSRIQLTQQCRPGDLDRVEQAYKKLGFKAELSTFFDDLPIRLAEAHLVISRSGASTVAELLALGRPSVLVPLPTSLEGDQLANAEVLAKEGAAWLIEERELSGEALAERLRTCLDQSAELATMAASAAALGRPDAAHALADELEQLFPGIGGFGPPATDKKAKNPMEAAA